MDNKSVASHEASNKDLRTAQSMKKEQEKEEKKDEPKAKENLQSSTVFMTGVKPEPAESVKITHKSSEKAPSVVNKSLVHASIESKASD